MGPKRIAVIDEHEVFRRGVVGVLSEDRSLRVVAEAAEGPIPDDADVVVCSPLAFRDLAPECPAVVCWGPFDPPLARPPGRTVAIVEREGVRGEELLLAVRVLAAGMRLDANGNGIHSTADDLDWRHKHILQLLAEGADTRHISRSLCYSERTIKSLISSLEDQLSARTRAEAVAKGIRLGLI
jgi:DNA-binding NarL/FixJ family response regulator